MQWRVRVADAAIARVAPRGSRTGEGINQKTHAETLYILILSKPEASIRASPPGKPLARAAAGATEKPCRMMSPARLQQTLVYRHPVVLVFRYDRLHIVR